MKWKELKEKSATELQKLLKSSQEHLRELRFKTSNDQLKNVREIRTVKKTIAQILTILKQRSSHKLANKNKL